MVVCSCYELITHNYELVRDKMLDNIENRTERKPTITGTREQTACRFCRRGIKYIDYKDIETLQKLLTNRGKIYSRKRSGSCAKCQRKAKKAIKRARYMALLPFTT